MAGLTLQETGRRPRGAAAHRRHRPCALQSNLPAAVHERNVQCSGRRDRKMQCSTLTCVVLARYLLCRAQKVKRLTKNIRMQYLLCSWKRDRVVQCRKVLRASVSSSALIKESVTVHLQAFPANQSCLLSLSLSISAYLHDKFVRTCIFTQPNYEECIPLWILLWKRSGLLGGSDNSLSLRRVLTLHKCVLWSNVGPKVSYMFLYIYFDSHRCVSIFTASLFHGAIDQVTVNRQWV